MLHPKFSLIIPVYQVEQYLAECLDSVLAQTYTDYEIICVNDGSTDSSLAILENYALKYRQINVINQVNKGLSAARNTGIKAACGEYLFFLDSDDWIEPHTLEILNNNTAGQDLVCFNGRRYFEDGTTEIQDVGLNEDSIKGWDYYTKYALVQRNFHFVCTVLRIYNREFLLKNHLFFEEGIYHEDNLFTPIICYFAQTVKVIPECLYVYRIRKGSITQSYNAKRLQDMVFVANKLSDFFIAKENIDKSQLYKEIAGEYFGVFLPENKLRYEIDEKDLVKSVNWINYKTVSTYSRHKRIYLLLSIDPVLFRLYFEVECFFKGM